MTDREKLRNLIGRVQDEGVSYVDCFSDDDKPDYIGNYELADYLIANGVTFATDTNVGSKWISVEDDKPKTKKVIDGEVYYRNVVVLTDEEIIPEKIAYYDEDFDVWFQPLDILPLRNVTHWMPLPEPPRED